MDDVDKRMLRTVISSRLEIALKRLKENPHFMEILQRQNETESVVDELLLKLEKDERTTVRRHLEKGVEKESEELKEAYIQGLMDCIQLLSFLGVFRSELSL